MSSYENALKEKGFKIIAGVDEAGRGPLAGPVVAAACIFLSDLFLPNLNDSKKVTPKKREELYHYLVNSKEIVFSVGIVDSKTIDEINILQATFKAMQRAVWSLSKKPEYLLIDGNQLPSFPVPAKGIIKGDSLSISIAAASIIAKQTRDNIMAGYHNKWPEYNFLGHKGYGTKKHLEALQKHGPSEIHRKSFAPVKSLVR